MKRCAIYGRFSIDSQITDNQILELKGFVVTKIFTEESISVAKWREIRTGFFNIIKGAINKHFDIMLCCSVEWDIL